MNNAVTLHGETALVSIAADVSPFSNSPRARFVAVVQRTAEEWDLQAKLISQASEWAEDYGPYPFGTAIGLTDDSALVGDSDRQKVYVFPLDQ